MKILNILSNDEKEMLLKFPVYISLLAVNHGGHADNVEKKTAIKFSHIKTYSSDPLLYDFYQEADKVFEKNFIELDRCLPEGKEERENAIKTELAKLENILLKLGKEYVLIMHRSMESFKHHVSRAHRNVLEYFVFPMPIKGLTD